MRRIAVFVFALLLTGALLLARLAGLPIGWPLVAAPLLVCLGGALVAWLAGCVGIALIVGLAEYEARRADSYEAGLQSPAVRLLRKGAPHLFAEPPAPAVAPPFPRPALTFGVGYASPDEIAADIRRQVGAVTRGQRLDRLEALARL